MSRPTAVSPGSNVRTTSRPCVSNHSVSRAACVDLPTPSPPSNTTNTPLMTPPRPILPDAAGPNPEARLDRQRFSSAHVDGPTTPSARSPRAFWNATVAARLSRPNAPSTAPL